jgi:hypothetical protein
VFRNAKSSKAIEKAMTDNIRENKGRGKTTAEAVILRD